MGHRCILDTNIVIYYLEGILSSTAKTVVDEAMVAGVNLSVISKIELLCWNAPQESNAGKIHSFFHDSVILGLHDVIIENTIQLIKNHHKIKLPDAIIAATALSFNLTLITQEQVPTFPRSNN